MMGSTNSPIFEVAVMFFGAAFLAFLYMAAGQIQNPLFWGVLISITIPIALFVSYLYRNGRL